MRGLVDGLRAIVDGLRSGASLRSAVIRAAGTPGSPFAPVAAALAEGRPLAPVLSTAAETSGSAMSSDPELASAFCVLAVQAQAGGDPLPAIRALAERITRRGAAREEARAFTTQARLGARAILLLTPAFLLLVAASDPRGTVAWFSQPTTRICIAAGLVLQIAGAVWVSSIVRGVAPADNALTRLPILRAVRAIALGRARSGHDADVSACAGTIALALDSGLSPSAALRAVALYTGGAFGEALRDAVADVSSSAHGSLARSVSALDDPDATRFARAFASGAELGVPLADAMRNLASDIDERASIALAEDSRRASVRVLLPLGLLVLPAFVLACLVPLFVGGLQGIAG